MTKKEHISFPKWIYRWNCADKLVASQEELDNHIGWSEEPVLEKPLPRSERLKLKAKK